MLALFVYLVLGKMVVQSTRDRWYFCSCFFPPPNACTLDLSRMHFCEAGESFWCERFNLPSDSKRCLNDLFRPRWISRFADGGVADAIWRDSKHYEKWSMFVAICFVRPIAALAVTVTRECEGDDCSIIFRSARCFALMWLKRSFYARLQCVQK